MDSVAIPLASSGTGGPSGLPLSQNCTWPVGTFVAPVTVALRLTFSPQVDFAGWTSSAVALGPFVTTCSSLFDTLLA